MSGSDTRMAPSLGITGDFGFVLHGVQPSLDRNCFLVVPQMPAAWMAAEPNGPPTMVHCLSSLAG